MSMLYERALRPALFRLSGDDPERAHEWAMRLLAAASRPPLARTARAIAGPGADPRLRQRLFGLSFPNPVGVAAGFDKDAVALHALAALGFGSIEAGTVTFHPQEGNPRPRLVRLPEQLALINRMGFNNAGAAAVARRLARNCHPGVPLGISLGKSRATPFDGAVDDYRASFRLLAPHADYVAVNVSSPNTPGLRALQEREAIDALLAALREDADALAARGGGLSIPLLVKVSPDLEFAALDELLAVCMARGVAGVIAVNTTTARPAGVSVTVSGGLSGRPLFARALEVVRHIDRETGGALPVIGVGGIFTAADAYAMLRAGARLVQVYTGLIYEGPAIARRINRGLVRLLERDGLTRIEELFRDRR